MQLLLNIKNEQVLDKLLWVLEHFKKDGIEICDNPNIIEKQFNPQEYYGLANIDKNLIDNYLEKSRNDWE